MAISYRLKGLHIFLILLVVLLIGYLLNYTWESFQCGCGNSTKEGFGNLEGYGEVLPGYSVDEKKVVKLYGNVFFDPAGKNFIEIISENTLKITDNENKSTNHIIKETNAFSLDNVLWSSNTTDGSYAVLSNNGILEVFNSSNEKVWSSPQPTEAVAGNSFLTPQNDGNLVIYKGLNPSENDGSVWSSNTSGRQGISNETYKGTNGTFGQDFMKNGERLNSGQWLGSPDGSTVLKMNADGSLILYAVSGSGSEEQNNYVVPTTSNAGKSFIYLGKTKADQTNTLACLYVPIQSSLGTSTSIAFIHILDLEKTTFKSPKHLQTFYFNGQEVISESIMQNIGDIARLNGTTAKFETSLDEDLKNMTSGDDFSVNVGPNADQRSIKIVARMNEIDGSNGFHALLAFAENGDIKLVAVESSAGNKSDEIKEDLPAKGGSDCNLAKKMKEYKELQEALFGFQEMKSSFYNYGSSDDYFLKTEVVPPVCPACPSCPHSSGVCNNCGGNGGSGTTCASSDTSSKKNESQNGSGKNGDSLIRDAGSGASSLVRDGVSGADDLVRDAASGATGLARDTVDGTGKFAQTAASGTYDAAKEVASGTVGLGREIVGGVFDAASNIIGGTVGLGKDVVGGAVGLGKDAVGGAVGLGKDVVGGIAKGVPRYGSSGQTNGQGGPTAQMGGYQHSYGGGYSNSSSPPQTPGQDPYSYYGSVPTKPSSNFIPRTANFSSFGR